MTAQSVPYRFITCNGKIDNLIHPACPAVSPGVLDPTQNEHTVAASAGWSKDGAKDFCPSCTSLRSPETPKPRRVKTPSQTILPQPAL